MASGVIEKLSNDSANGYCKFPDGTLMCWGTISIPNSTTISNTWGSVYESARIAVSINFPVAFVSAPELIVSLKSNPVTFLENTLTASTTGIDGAYWLMRPQSATLDNGSITWFAIGRWK